MATSVSRLFQGRSDLVDSGCKVCLTGSIFGGSSSESEGVGFSRIRLLVTYPDIGVSKLLVDKGIMAR